MTLCFATNNPNKIKEIAALVGSDFTIRPMSEYGINEDIPEPGDTLEENSMIKAKKIFDELHIPVIADDSGLEVSILNGEPGVKSARYAGESKIDSENTSLLLNNLKGQIDRSAQFRTVITLLSAGESIQFEGIVKGHIIMHPRGTHGFGYDPVFEPLGFNRTFAEMTFEEKNNLSHRAIAFNKLADHLNAK